VPGVLAHGLVVGRASAAVVAGPEADGMVITPLEPAGRRAGAGAGAGAGAAAAEAG
jgi:hypothetical protein